MFMTKHAEYVSNLNTIDISNDRFWSKMLGIKSLASAPKPSSWMTFIELIFKLPLTIDWFNIMI